jgi:hypothetical protein
MCVLNLQRCFMCSSLVRVEHPRYYYYLRRHNHHHHDHHHQYRHQDHHSSCRGRRLIYKLPTPDEGLQFTKVTTAARSSVVG